MVLIKNVGKCIFLFVALSVFSQGPPNTPPVPENDFDTADINTTLTVNAPGLLSNDNDPDGDPITITQFIVNGMTFMAGQTANLAEGDITVNADGSFTFVPAAGYTGFVPDVIYQISDGTDIAAATLFLTVETNGDLLGLPSISTCNQGYIAPTAAFPNGAYKIQYSISVFNQSIARDDHPNSLITNIQFFNDLDAIFGDPCVILIERQGLGSSTATPGVSTTNPPAFMGGFYPAEFTILDWDTAEFSETDPTPGADGLLTAAAQTNILYPRQNLSLSYCVYVDPTCAASDPIDFTNTVTITSSRGTQTASRTTTDFHTSETTVAANFFIPQIEPDVEPDGTFDYTNTVIITNDGPATANNVNYNMGLGSFLDNGVSFASLNISQISGPPVTVNNTYDGDTDTLLLAGGNSLNAGETIILEVNYVVNPLASSNIFHNFLRPNPSMSQGAADGFDETTAVNMRFYSYVIWSDGLGNHLDQYYIAANATEIPTSQAQCECVTARMRFLYIFNLGIFKSSTVTNTAPQGVLEHEEVTFEITATNNSPFLQIENIQITDDLTAICGGNILSVSTPVITSTTATTPPNIDPSFDGIANLNILDGTSGVLEPGQNVVVQFRVIFQEDCIGNNLVNFSAADPQGLNTASADSNLAPVNVFTDSDNDGITNVNDIDDDNDTIPDIIENNGFDPLLDTNGDNIPDYLDPTAPSFVDNDGNGINDNYDFDGDGILNHLDLDSDNDGIYDILESGNGALDTNSNGMTDTIVGANGLNDAIEDDDSFTPTAYTTIVTNLINTDGTGNNDYQDIDADNDGIVDVIEGQTSAGYISPNGVYDASGLDTAFAGGLNPTDTDGDLIPDFIDTNADNDIRDDVIEGWDLNNDGIAETVASGLDLDNDGLDDAFDNDTNAVNPTNGQVPTDFPNVDNPATPELDWRENIAIVVVIDDVNVLEGGILTYTIQLTTLNDPTILVPSTTDVSIDIFTVDGTTTATQFEIANAPFDYDQIPNAPTTITIPAGQTSTTVTVQTLEDTIFEQDELLTLTGNITTGNTENTQINGIGTILDNDNPPDITMNDTRENEGISLVHTITLSNPSSIPITIDVATSDNSAISPEDYTSFTGTVTIPGTVDEANANLQGSFSIVTIIDNLNEQDEENLAVIGVVTSGTVGNQDLNKTGIIVDIDPDPTVIIDSPEVVEGNVLIFTITLSNLNFNDVNLNIFTNIDTATSPEDYTAISTTVTIPAQTLTTTVQVLSIDDSLVEEPEQFILQGVVTTFNTANNDPSNVGRILDNDLPNLFSPNGDGFSDVFELIALEPFPEFELKIFDRWGSIVYDYQNRSRPQPVWWDGTLYENPVPEGVYYYTIKYNDGVTKPTSGFVQLIR